MVVDWIRVPGRMDLLSDTGDHLLHTGNPGQGLIADLIGKVRIADLASIKDPGEDLLYVPTAAALRPGDDTGIYVTTQAGLVLRFDTDRKRFDRNPFADFTARVRKMRKAGSKLLRPMEKETAKRWREEHRFTHLKFPDGFKDMGFSDERGLLGLAFDPKRDGKNGRRVYYVHLSTASNKLGVDHNVEIIRLEEEPEGAEVTSSTILRLEEPQFNHNGGQVSFGPDGYLYVALGDGGGFRDEHGKKLRDKYGKELPGGSFFGNGQDPTTLHGSILRLDVSEQRLGYRIPLDNPLSLDQFPTELQKYFSGPHVRREIWAMGLRNPWKFTWNPQNPRAMFVADVGQDEWEEVNMITAPGGNFGWRAMEGHAVFDGPLSELLDAAGVCHRPPILTYSHAVGVAVIGGYVLAEGSRLAEDLRGSLERALDLKQRIRSDRLYIYGDYVGKIFMAFQLKNYEWRSVLLHNFKDRNIHSFARDKQDRVYVLWTTTFGKSGEKQSGISLIDMDGGGGSRVVSNRKIKTWDRYVVVHRPPRHHHLRPSLSKEDMMDIATRALRAAEKTDSGLRWDTHRARPAPACVWVAVRRRSDKRYYVVSSDAEDAWEGSFEICQNKAYTAMAFSSDKNALSTRSMQTLSKDALWEIASSTSKEERYVLFPGGFPLYKQGMLVGAVGVSGDTVDVDEIIALAATRGYEAPGAIRIDARSKGGDVPYAKTSLI